jgi:TolA-binding protein
MRNFLILVLCVFSFNAFANFSMVAKEVGKIVYMEGNVEISSGDEWTKATIGTVLSDLHIIRTHANAMVEILWDNNTKTVLEEESEMKVNVIYESSSPEVVEETEGVFSRFKNLFKSSSKKARAEEGGIRRNQVKADTVPNPESMYWKEINEITYEEAALYYENGDYVKAISAFKSFLNQKPLDKMSKYAMFALGHSYIMVNNNAKAKETFEKFVVKYANDGMKTDAEQILTKLSI